MGGGKQEVPKLCPCRKVAFQVNPQLSPNTALGEVPVGPRLQGDPLRLEAAFCRGSHSTPKYRRGGGQNGLKFQCLLLFCFVFYLEYL